MTKKKEEAPETGAELAVLSDKQMEEFTAVYAGEWGSRGPSAPEIKISYATDETKGKYVIKMTALSGDWAAIRYEVNTGQSWHCRAGAWVEITLAPVEPIDQSANPTSSDETKEQP